MKYFNVVIWPNDPVYIHKVIGGNLQPTDEMPPEVVVEKSESYKRFKKEAYDFFNNWGNDTRGRK